MGPYSLTYFGTEYCVDTNWFYRFSAWVGGWVVAIASLFLISGILYLVLKGLGVNVDSWTK